MSVDLINLSKSEIRRIKRDKVLEKKYKEDKKNEKVDW